MGNWKEWLKEIDDDYLIGISNKGLVKRAYKDKEAGDYEVLSMEEEAGVRVGEETVQVRYPLGESGCSCPSRTICRHVILGILAVKEQTQAEGTNVSEKTEDADGGAAETAGEEQNAETETGVADTVQDTEAGTIEKPPLTELEAEIAAYPFASLQKILGVRYLQAMISDVRSMQRPEITKTSIITVKLPRKEQTVKLLSPLEYSTCTCHKKEFCVHKAAAVLWYQLEHNMTTLDELEKETGDKTEYEIGQIREAARQMKEFLEELPKPITGYRYQYKWEKSQYVTQDFKDKVAGISRELGIDPDDLMAVMAFESRFNPAQKNLAGGSATGLVQFMPTVAEELNTTTSKLAQMEGVEQLDYVFGYLYSEKGKIKTLDDIYMKVLCPEAIGKSDNYPIYSKGDNRYEANKNLDLNKDGIISKKEAVQVVIDRRSEYI